MSEISGDIEILNINFQPISITAYEFISHNNLTWPNYARKNIPYSHRGRPYH